MQLDLTNVDFTIAVNTFHDDIQDKLQILSNMELDFMRKFQNRVLLPQHHSHMIYEIRKMVASIQQMYKDIKDYFAEMKVSFLYDFIRKIQTLMIIGYNHLSQALLITFDEYETEKKLRETNDQHNNKCATCGGQLNPNRANFNKLSIEKLQKIDYTINSIQEEQSRLMQQMSTMYQMMLTQKNTIEKLKPSLASKQIEEMKDHMETVIEDNQKLFQETYIMRHSQFSNQIKNYQKPQQIKIVCQKANDNFKKSFIKQTLKAAQMIQKARKYEQGRMISVEVQTVEMSKMKVRKNSAVPNKEINYSPGHSNSKGNNNSNHTQILLSKQRKLNEKINIELNHLHKQNSTLSQQLELYKQAERQIQVKYKQLVEKFQTLQEMYKKVKIQLDQANQRMLKMRQRQYGQENNQIVVEQEHYEQNQQNNQQTSKNTKHQQQLSIKPLHSNKSVQTDNRRLFYLQTKISTQHNNIDQMKCQPVQTQTQDEFATAMLTQSQTIKQLKSRNERNIIMLNEKDRKVRELTSRLTGLEEEDVRLKANINHFIESIERKLLINKSATSYNLNPQQLPLPNNNCIQIQSKLNLLLPAILQKQQQLQQMYQTVNNNINLSQKQQPIQKQSDNNLQIVQQQEENDSSKLINNQILQQNKKRKRLSVFNMLPYHANQRKRSSNQILINISTSTQTDQTQLTTHKTNITQSQQAYTQTQMIQNYQIQKPTTTTHNRRTTTQKINKQKIQHFYIKPQIKHKRISAIQDTIRYSQTNLEITNKKKPKLSNTNLNTFESLKINQPYQNCSLIFKPNENPQNNCELIFKPKTDNNSLKIINQAQKLLQTKTDMDESMLSPFQVIEEEKQRATKLSTLLQNEESCIFSSRLKPIYNQPQKEENDKKYQRLRTTLDRDSQDKTINKLLNNNSHDKSSAANMNKISKRSHKRLVSQLVSSFRPESRASQIEQNDFRKGVDQIDKSLSPACKILSPKERKQLAMTSSSSSNINLCYTLPSQPENFYSRRGQESGQKNKKKTLLLSIQKYKTQNSSINDILLGKYLYKLVDKWGWEKLNFAFDMMRSTAKK